MGDTVPLPLPPINMRRWHIVWPGEPWIQPIDRHTGLVADYQTPMCRFCHSLFNHHAADCMATN